MHFADYSLQPWSQHDKLYGGDPNFYWKQNYYFNWLDNPLNSLNISPFEDRIQANSLSEHKQVILRTVEEISLSIRFSIDEIGQLPPPQYSVLNLESADELFVLLADYGILSTIEATHLSKIFIKRNDWKKLCIQLIQTVENKYHFDLAYIFYISLKIVIDIKSFVKLTCSELRQLLNTYIEENQNSVEERLQILTKVSGSKEILEKLCLTMMLAIYGIFVNPFYDAKEQKYKNTQFSIKQQESSCRKRKSIKIKNRKLYSTRQCIPLPTLRPILQ